LFSHRESCRREIILVSEERVLNQEPKPWEERAIKGSSKDTSEWTRVKNTLVVRIVTNIKTTGTEKKRW
jgi:hypothetical protein